MGARKRIALRVRSGRHRSPMRFDRASSSRRGLDRLPRMRRPEPHCSLLMVSSKNLLLTDLVHKPRAVGETVYDISCNTLISSFRIPLAMETLADLEHFAVEMARLAGRDIETSYGRALDIRRSE